MVGLKEVVLSIVLTSICTDLAFGAAPTVTSSCECGSAASGSSSIFRDRITNGVKTTIDEHPHIVQLKVGGSFRCGGSIISNRYILTAAHCVDDIPSASVSLLTVVAGSTTQSPNDGTTFTAEEIWVHPSWDSLKLFDGNDIALIRVDTDITFSSTIHPICLPKQDQRLPLFRRATVAGWGRTGGFRPTSNDLLEANVKALTASQCNSRTLYSNLSDNLICGRSFIRKGACNGDSGGPLLSCKLKGLKFVRYISGVVSFGRTGCLNTFLYPTVFTNVAKYRDEIWAAARDTEFCENPLD